MLRTNDSEMDPAERIEASAKCAKCLFMRDKNNRIIDNKIFN